MAAAADGTAKGHVRPSLATAGQPMRELFIYYRSRVECEAEVAAQVRGFQAHLMLEHPTLVARLLRRPEAKDGLLTWMETYAFATMNPDRAIDAPLQQQIEASAACLRGLIDGERHTEVFTTCAC
jgi:Domain of unknown function (DUF4936)